MEKVWNSDELLPKKIKSIMKITLLFLILGILHVSADTYAQKTPYSNKRKRSPVSLRIRMAYRLSGPMS